MNQDLIIYTDGACLGNPGPGGWAAVLIWGDKRKEISAGYKMTTNNRMEILAAIEALRAVKSSKRYNIKLHSDSRLLINAFNQGWLEKWKKNNWMRNHKEPVINPDLWKLLLTETAKHDVKFIWVEAHSGITENERCDQLSKTAAQSDNLLIDEYYENDGGQKLWVV